MPNAKIQAVDSAMRMVQLCAIFESQIIFSWTIRRAKARSVSPDLASTKIQILASLVSLKIAKLALRMTRSTLAVMYANLTISWTKLQINAYQTDVL